MSNPTARDDGEPTASSSFSEQPPEQAQGDGNPSALDSPPADRSVSQPRESAHAYADDDSALLASFYQAFRDVDNSNLENYTASAELGTDRSFTNNASHHLDLFEGQPAQSYPRAPQFRDNTGDPAHTASNASYHPQRLFGAESQSPRNVSTPAALPRTTTQQSAANTRNFPVDDVASAALADLNAPTPGILDEWYWRLPTIVVDRSTPPATDFQGQSDCDDLAYSLGCPPTQNGCTATPDTRELLPPEQQWPQPWTPPPPPSHWFSRLPTPDVVESRVSPLGSPQDRVASEGLAYAFSLLEGESASTDASQLRPPQQRAQPWTPPQPPPVWTQNSARASIENYVSPTGSSTATSTRGYEGCELDYSTESMAGVSVQSTGQPLALSDAAFTDASGLHQQQQVRPRTGQPWDPDAASALETRASHDCSLPSTSSGASFHDQSILLDLDDQPNVPSHRDARHPPPQASNVPAPDIASLLEDAHEPDKQTTRRNAKCNCPNCQPGGSNANLSFRDKRRVHACDFAGCAKTFSKTSHLKAHLKRHNNETPYLCQTCGKTFAVLDCLRRHLTTHSGEKSYVCPICGWRSARSDYLQKHVLTHSKSPEDKRKKKGGKRDPAPKK